MPFNEPLERLKQAGEVDMLPLDVVIYALDIPGIDFHKAEFLSVKFDYIYRLYTATLDEIAETDEMSREDAERVYHFTGKEKFIRKMNTLSVYRLQENRWIILLPELRNRNNGICRNSLMLWGFAISGRRLQGIWPVILRTSEVDGCDV